MKLLICTQNFAWFAVTIVMALSAAACGQKGPSGNKLGTMAPEIHRSGSGPESRAHTQGTVDGGGGAGFDGKPLESYRRDITDLEQFPEFRLVDEVIKSIERVNPSHAKIFRHIVRDRMWLFLNAPVPKISEDRQGSAYTIDQWAVQNSKEIWISDRYQGEASAKAKILLHEILVGLKIMRFLSYNEYCLQWTDHPARCDSNTSNEVLISDYKLSALDHADVRNMGEWLWEHHATMTPVEFGFEMHGKQFQSPHYSWQPFNSSSLGEERTLNPVIERLGDRPRELFTEWGPDSIARKKCVFNFQPDFQHRRMKIEVQVKELETGKIARTIQYDLAYDRNQEQRAALRSDVFGSLVTWNATDGREMKKLGDRTLSASIDLRNDTIVEFYAGESRVIAVKDGTTSSAGDNFGPQGLFCHASPVALPVQYNLWIELRENDREAIERKRFQGKTVDELMATISKNRAFELNR